MVLDYAIMVFDYMIMVFDYAIMVFMLKTLMQRGYYDEYLDAAVLI